MSVGEDSVSDVNALLSQLDDATRLKRSGKCIKFGNKIDGLESEIFSWKFNEWDYGKSKIKLPINARGLFTIGDKIVVRGYDKFFNINEVANTNLDYLKQNTSGPYEVTVKENGCIIFISGLSNGKLLVCSKHSVGQRDDSTRNHAIQGEIELEKQLEKLNISKEELALELHNNHMTAVAELCDDSFEEHVLAYSGESAGLYLHGLNFNTISFKTLPMTEVSNFAQKWGFKTIHYTVIQEFDELNKMLTECSKTGTYMHKEIEGFVIRCSLLEESFFFKYKFTEPYLLYRQLREVGKSLAQGDTTVHQILSKTKKHRFITLKFLEFLQKRFCEEPGLREEFLNGKGIIKLREDFMRENNLNRDSGLALIENERLNEKLMKLSLEMQPKKYKYILVPISTIACGKTTVFNTLNTLYPNWKHVQNDNIESKASKTKLVSTCLEHLNDDNVDVVFCDRNNHQYRERKQIFDQIDSLRDNYLSFEIGLRVIALNFVEDESSLAKIRSVSIDRIKSRGDNHQSIKYDTSPELAVKILDGFLNRFQFYDNSREPDSLFWDCLDLSVDNDSSLENSKKILKYLHHNTETVKAVPSDEEIMHAFNIALNYKPSFTKTFGNNKKQKTKAQFKVDKYANQIKEPTYFGIEIFKNDIYPLLEEKLYDSSFWKTLKEEGGLNTSFHVTLAHVASVGNDDSRKVKYQILNRMLEKYGEKNSEKSKVKKMKIFCDLSIEKLVVAENFLTCFVVSILKSYDIDGILLDLPWLNNHLHITIGTAPQVKPYQSNLLLEQLSVQAGNEFSAGHYEFNSQNVHVFDILHVPINQRAVFAYY